MVSLVIRSPRIDGAGTETQPYARARAWRGLQIRLVRQKMAGNEPNSDDVWKTGYATHRLARQPRLAGKSVSVSRPSDRVTSQRISSHHHQKCRTSAVLRLVDRHMVAPKTRRGALYLRTFKASPDADADGVVRAFHHHPPSFTPDRQRAGLRTGNPADGRSSSMCK